MAETESIEQPVEPGDCILFATADWDEPYWTNKQHCAKELSRLGWRVLYVESMGLRAPKAGSKKDIRRLWLRLRKGVKGLIFGAIHRDENLWVMSPLAVPGAHNHKWLGRLNQFLLKYSLKRHVSSHSFKHPLIWTYHPFMMGAIKNLDHGTVLYHCVDNLGEFPGVDSAGIRTSEIELLKLADVVFATAPSLARRCRQYNRNTHYLPNVVDAEHFGKALELGPVPADLACIPEPRLCYHGVLSDFKIDFQLLLEVARLRPEWNWILIGEQREGQNSSFVAELGALPNVHMLGYKPYTQLPDYLRGMQLGMLPSLINEYTRGMFPMKYYEFIAAGLRIVSTPLAFSAECTDAMAIGRDAEGFVAAIESQLEKGSIAIRDIKSLVGDNTWQKRLQKMLLRTRCFG